MKDILAFGHVRHIRHWYLLAPLATPEPGPVSPVNGLGSSQISDYVLGIKPWWPISRCWGRRRPQSPGEGPYSPSRAAGARFNRMYFLLERKQDDWKILGGKCSKNLNPTTSAFTWNLNCFFKPIAFLLLNLVPLSWERPRPALARLAGPWAAASSRRPGCPWTGSPARIASRSRSRFLWPEISILLTTKYIIYWIADNTYLCAQVSWVEFCGDVPD